MLFQCWDFSMYICLPPALNLCFDKIVKNKNKKKLATRFQHYYTSSLWVPIKFSWNVLRISKQRNYTDRTFSRTFTFMRWLEKKRKNEYKMLIKKIKIHFLLWSERVEAITSDVYCCCLHANNKHFSLLDFLLSYKLW